MSDFEIISINISKKKGQKKKPVLEAEIRENFGIVGDAHAANWNRQISLLACESVDKMRNLGLNVKPGDFAENITTKGINLPILPVGTKLKLNAELEVEVTQIGKECHTKCAIYKQAGDCVMPKEGIFVKVLKGGFLKVGDAGKVVDKL